MKLNVGILGGGSWGTTVASLTAKNSNATLWARNENAVREINEEHTNSRYLPGAKLHKSLKANILEKFYVLQNLISDHGYPSLVCRKV